MLLDVIDLSQQLMIPEAKEFIPEAHSYNYEERGRFHIYGLICGHMGHAGVPHLRYLWWPLSADRGNISYINRRLGTDNHALAGPAHSQQGREPQAEEGPENGEAQHNER